MIDYELEEIIQEHARDEEQRESDDHIANDDSLSDVIEPDEVGMVEELSEEELEIFVKEVSKSNYFKGREFEEYDNDPSSPEQAGWDLEKNEEEHGTE